MAAREDHLVVLAGTSAAPNQRAAGMVLTSASDRWLGSWRHSEASISSEQAALLAIVEGLRQAREHRAQRVTVLCALPALSARLNRLIPTAWDEPVARLWIQARALSHAFARCEFRAVNLEDIRSATRLAETALHGELSLAA
ncbi:MAG TPA: reverse transcriptase-like protein [Armatimonadota bacterium]|nr:reverse transcriptase-like protein [Armatimonadota bacterium]